MKFTYQHSYNSHTYALRPTRHIIACGLALLSCVTLSTNSVAQNFDFASISAKAEKYQVVVEAMMSFSFGSETHDAKIRALGTIVTPQGLAIMDGSLIEFDDGMAAFYGGASPEVKSLSVTTMAGEKLNAEWLGSDRYTRVGFLKIQPTTPRTFTSVTFSPRKSLRVGEWVALYTLLPDNVKPPLAADIGMVSALLIAPEKSPLIVGFSEGQSKSVLYDTSGAAIGILSGVGDAGSGGMGESMDEESFTLLGILNNERLQKLILDPPEKGKKSRGWLGVSMQALTKEMADYWGITDKGGIIVNEVIKNSPAESAGLAVGDVLVAINGDPLNIDTEQNLTLFSRRVSELGAGSGVDLTILRKETGGYERRELVALLTNAPLTSSEAATYADTVFDFKTRDMVFNDYLTNNLKEDEVKGVVIIEVTSGGWADVGGLEPGDIVELINGQETPTIAEVKSIMKVAKDKRVAEAVFFVWRNNKTLFVNVKPTWQ